MRALPVAGLLFLAVGIPLMGLHVARYPPQIPDPAVALGIGGGLQAEKLLDMARAVGWLAVLNLAAWSLGSLPERVLRHPSGRSEFSLLYRLGFGFAALSLVVLAMAGLHALEGPTLYGAILIPAAAAAALLAGKWRRHSLGVGRPGAATWLVLAAIPFCLNSFLGVFSPDPGWDALTYHLAIPERTLFANGIVVTPFSHLTAYPFLMQMLYVPALFLHGPALATLLHFEFGVLLLGAVHLAARRFSGLAAVLAPAILLADPLFQRELSWAYNDLTFAFYTLLAVIALHEWSLSPAPSLPSYAGAFIGVSVLVKIHGAFVLAALLVALWLAPRRQARASLLASLCLVGMTLLVCSPWLIRNLAFTGNPFSPLLQSVFYTPGGEYFDPTAIEQATTFLSRIGMGRSLGAFVMLPWNLVMRSAPGVYSNSFGFQITPLYVLGALAALLIPEVRRHAWMRRFLAVGGLLTVFWFLSFQEPRFLLPALSCFAVAGGAALAAVTTGLPGWGRVVPVLPLAALIYCQALLLQNLPTGYGYALGSLSIDEFEARDPAEAAAATLRTLMGPRDRLLLFAESRGFLFRGLDYIPYHINEGSHVLQWIHRQSDLDAMHCALRAQGVTYLLINVEQLREFPPIFLSAYREEDFGRDLALVQAFAKTRMRTVFERDGILVGAILDPPSCPP